MQQTRKQKANKRIRGVLLLLICCLFVTLSVCRNQIETMTVSGSDGMTYFNAARNLRKYHLLTHDRDGSMYEGLTEAVPTESLAPGYPLFLAFLFIFFPESLNTVFVSNLVLGVITLLFLWKMLLALNVHPWLSLCVVLLYVFYPPTVDMTTTCLTENLFIPLLFGSLCFCVCASQRANHENGIRYVAGSFFLLFLASTVRGQAFLFFPLQLILLLSKSASKRQRIILPCIGAGIFILMYLPIWGWLYGQLGRFVLYPSAGDGPRIWGAMPYFIDMTWSGSRSLSYVQQYNSTVAPGEYYRWRSFGMIWRMWFDCWSEDLPHSWHVTHWALWLHPLFVLPTLVSLSIFARRYSREELFLAAVPLTLTVACLFYHGLPRYVSAAYPVLFVLGGKNLQFIAERGKLISARIRNRESQNYCRKKPGWKRMAVMAAGSIFSLVLLYSLCVFPWRVDEEQSSYRLKKYEGVKLEDVRAQEPVYTRVFRPEEISVWNALPMGDGRYQISWDSHAIIQLSELDLIGEEDGSAVVTRVKMNVEGGNIYDFSTVYWLKKGLTAWNEDNVYSVPRSSVSWMEANAPEVFIDGDAEALLIVPALFYGNEIALKEIAVEKYSVAHEPSDSY